MAQKLDCEVVTVERVVFRGEADMVIAQGVEGEMGILPRHAPLLAALREGVLVIRNAGDEDIEMAIGGGVIEVLNNRVVILADSAERAEEIDEARAQAARQRVLEKLASRRISKSEQEAVEAALRRSMARLKVIQRRRRKRGGGAGGASEPGDSHQIHSA